MNNDEPFTLVTNKRNRRRKSFDNKKSARLTEKIQPAGPLSSKQLKITAVDGNKNRRRKLIDENIQEVKESNLCKKLFELLNDKEIIKTGDDRELVCFGLGSLSSYISRHQLALGLVLAKELKVVSVKYSDPCFSVEDTQVLEDLGIRIITENLEGKYLCDESYVTIFYLPHCPKQLVNNLLWRNWKSSLLAKIILITNSFETILERTSSRLLENSAGYIVKINPYSCENQLPEYQNSPDIFNDLSVISFDKVKDADSSVWDTVEPVYEKYDLELVQNGIEGL